MAFAFKTGFVWYCLCLVVCISGNTVTASFEILRGKSDTFANLKCQKSNDCIDEQCAKYGAKCVDDKCERCRCKVGSATFLVSDSTTGNCAKDENIIPESVPEQSFRLEKLGNNSTQTNQCLTIADEQNYNISGKSCSSSLNMKWIWTITQIENGQNQHYLMNVMTLQCLEFLDCKSNGNKQNTREVALKQCSKTDGQYITVDENARTIHGDCGPRKYYLRLEMKRDNVGYAAFSERNKLDRWTNSKIDDPRLSDSPTTYTGCYRFHNERFMLYLDKETCRENLCSRQFSAPIFYENAKCDAEWSKSKIVYSDNVQLQNITEISTRKLVSIESGPGNSSNIKTLKVYQEGLTIFNGSLVRLVISCANEMNPNLVENQCLLLKFKSLLRKNVETTTISSAIKTSSEMTTSSTTTTSPTIKLENKDTEESSTNMIAITAVAVSLFAVIFTLVCFVCYRKKKRRLKLSNVQDQNQPPTLEESTLPLNPLEPSNSNQLTQMSKHYEVPCERQYEYVDKTAIVPPKTFTYDYAVFDGPLKSDHGTRVGLNRTGEDDYVIKNDAGDTSYISVTDASSLTDQNQPPTLKESTVPLNPLQPSNSNQSTQRISQHYEVPCERQYDYVDKTAITPPKTFTYDYAVFDGPLKNNHGTRVGLNRTGEDDYVIKNDAKMMQETHHDYVVRDESYVSVIDPKPERKDEDMHDDYVIRDESYVSVIEPRPETKDEETHDDYVVRDESYVSVIEPRPETKDEETHDYVVRDESYVSVIEPRPEIKDEETHSDDYVHST